MVVMVFLSGHLIGCVEWDCGAQGVGENVEINAPPYLAWRDARFDASGRGIINVDLVSLGPRCLQYN